MEKENNTVCEHNHNIGFSCNFCHYFYFHTFLNKSYKKNQFSAHKNTKNFKVNKTIELKLDFNYIYELKISKNNSFIIIRNKDGKIKISDFPNLKIKNYCLIDKKTILNISLARNVFLNYHEKKIGLMSGHSDGSILLWNLKGKILSSIKNKQKNLIQAFFHNTNKILHSLDRNGRWSMWDIENSKMLISKKFLNNSAKFMDISYFHHYLLICFKKKIIFVDCINFDNITTISTSSASIFKKAKFCNRTNSVIALNNEKKIFKLNQQLKKIQTSRKLEKLTVSDFHIAISQNSFVSIINSGNILKIWNITKNFSPIYTVFHEFPIISNSLNIANFLDVIV
uniref:Uncharacterized protein n=1 Tax=Lotharella vacuolata TaxID=74820 RepID=A0A0H5BHP7_9EUKA|nr:hypothetical protein [Lotharella vacuolata]